MEENGAKWPRQGKTVSAAEGERFASKVREMKTIVGSVTSKEIENARKVFEKALSGD
jgi:hypothetical protein